MGSLYKVLTHLDLENIVNEQQAFSLDVLVGLSEKPKRLSSRYFYDDRGSELFAQIMDLPEYYLTKCEFNVLKRNRKEIEALLTDGKFNLVELGAGDGRKTSILIENFLNHNLKFKYIPIDISEAAMKNLIETMNEKFPSLHTDGIVAEYFNGLKWLGNVNAEKSLVLFLGSNLGNFNKPQSRVFLRNLWNTLNDGDLLITGFDLKKDIDVMRRAYNDSRGITSEFNLNLLRRINRELGGNFDLNKFRHFASYDVFSGAMESYLVSLERQTVYIEAVSQNFFFEAWEPIHTEYSYKYLESDIRSLAETTGFTIEKQLYDSRKYFIDSVWRVQKITPDK
ncbi:MAG: L-histidine N(alpha)-methyltransferase [Calditrichaeota bacterium]|nr:L-histidine N(alpha)-methyltransferase [Calditrichota bacterium]RQW01757.1 MAG: L-histidine N(alpha)-methyltransferase [Calditrichota bacterium]